jgi:hypothetical protein
MAPGRDAVAATLLVVSVLLASSVSSYYVRRRPPSAVAAVQPLGVAFSIWGVIFLAGLLRAGLTLRCGDDRQPSILLHAASFVASAAWAPLFAADMPRLSCAAIAVATALAYASLVLSNQTAVTWTDLLVDGGIDLLAGWLGVAFGISLVLAGWAGDDTLLLLGLSAATSVAAGVTHRPFLLPPVVWALVLQRTHDSRTRAAVAIALAGLAWAAIGRERM